MIQNYSYSPGVYYVQLMWNSPKYNPEKYLLQYSCMSQTGVYYCLNNNLEIRDSSSTSVSVFGLNPESICFMTIFAVYNPASIDQGMTITTKTLRAEEANCK